MSDNVKGVFSYTYVCHGVHDKNQIKSLSFLRITFYEWNGEKKRRNRNTGRYEHVGGEIKRGLKKSFVSKHMSKAQVNVVCWIKTVRMMRIKIIMIEENEMKL